MPADLSPLFREARARIDVPPVPPAVRAAAREGTARHAGVRAPRSVRSRLAAASLVGLSLVAVAAAAELVIGPQITISPAHGITVGFDRLPEHPKRDLRSILTAPKAASPDDVRAVARSMDFPVTLPAGVPGDGRPTMVMPVGSSAMIFDYNLPGAWRRDDHVLEIVLANPREVAAAPPAHAPKHTYTVTMGPPAAVRWRVGGEDVIVMKSRMTAAETEHLHHAMLAAAAQRK
jgi:hypothetical protein